MVELSLLAASVARAAVVGAACAGLGLVAGLAVGRASGRRRGLVLFGMLFPVFLPAYITTMVWIGLVGKGGLLSPLLPEALRSGATIFSWYGCLWVSALCYWPFAGLLACGAVKAIPQSEIEAALLMGDRRAAMRGVIARRILPAAVAGGMLAFALCLADFDIPALLIQRTYSAEIFYRLESSYDTAAAAWMSVPLMAVLLVAAALALFLMRGQAQALSRVLASPVEVPQRGERGTHVLFTTGKGRASPFSPSWPLAVSAVLLLSLSAGVPLVALAALAWPPANIALGVRVGGPQLWNSAVASLAAAAVSAVLGVAMLGLILFRRCNRRAAAARGIGMVALFAFVLPGPVLGLALTKALSSSPWLGFLYDGTGILVLAYLTRFFIFLWFPVSMAARQVADSSGFESARLAPGGGARLMWRIVLPPVVLPLLIGCLLVCCLGLGELSATIIAAPPGCDTVAMKIFDLLHFGHKGVVAGLCLVAALFVGGISLVATHLVGRYEISRG